MDPITIITDKLTQIGIPKDAVSSLDITKLIPLISDPHNLKANLIEQLTGPIGLDKSMIQGALNNVDMDSLLANPMAFERIKEQVMQNIETVPMEQAMGLWGKLKAFFRL
jgi:hypothetical protein